MALLRCVSRKLLPLLFAFACAVGAHYRNRSDSGSVSAEQRLANEQTLRSFRESKRMLLSARSTDEARRRLNTAAAKFPSIMAEKNTFDTYLGWWNTFVVGDGGTCLGYGEEPAKTGCLLNRVAFHVVKKVGCSSATCGHVDVARIEEQIEQLNVAFSGQDASSNMKDGKNRWSGVDSAVDTGLRFVLHSVDYYENDDWHRCSNGICSSSMREMRYATAVRPDILLNVWSHDVSSAIGFVTQYPWDSQAYEANPMLGPAVHSLTVAGGGHAMYDQGDVLVHEIAHYFGVMHPYDGGCTVTHSSDGIDDTPRMSNNIKPSCSEVKSNLDTCSDSSGLNAGRDLIDNYMVITEDSCRWYFTPGQAEVMQAMIVRYRPTLLRLGHPNFPDVKPGCVTAIDSADNAPDLHPCWFGDWNLAAEQTDVPREFEYNGRTYTHNHGPILDAQPPGFSGGEWTDRRGWCLIDPSTSRWGYACCAYSRGDSCVDGLHDADVTNGGEIVPRSTLAPTSTPPRFSSPPTTSSPRPTVSTATLCSKTSKTRCRRNKKCVWVGTSKRGTCMSKDDVTPSPVSTPAPVTMEYVCALARNNKRRCKRQRKVCSWVGKRKEAKCVLTSSITDSPTTMAFSVCSQERKRYKCRRLNGCSWVRRKCTPAPGASRQLAPAWTLRAGDEES